VSVVQATPQNSYFDYVAAEEPNFITKKKILVKGFFYQEELFEYENGPECAFAKGA